MKKTLAILLVCMMAMAGLPAWAETWAVTMETGEEWMPQMALVDDAGTLLTPVQGYAEIYPLTDGVYIATALFISPEDLPEDAGPDEDGWWDIPTPHCLLSDDGTQLTGSDYQDFLWDPNCEKIMACRMDGGIDVLSRDGTLEMSTEYGAMISDGADGWLALPKNTRTEWVKGSLLHVDADGTERDTGYELLPWGLDPLKDGVLRAQVEEGEAYHTLLLDGQGRDVLGHSYDDIGEFRDGLAMAMVNDGDGYGIIDTTGAFLLGPHAYVDISYENEDGPTRWAATRKDGTVEVWSSDLKNLLARLRLSDDLGQIYYAALRGYELVLVDGENGSALVYCDGQDPQVLIGADAEGYWDATQDAPGIDRVRYTKQLQSYPDALEQLCDAWGNPLGEPHCSINFRMFRDGGPFAFEEWETIVDRDGDRVADWNTTRYGVIDRDGNEILPARYDSLRVLREDRFWVRMGNQEGMVDAEGNWLCAISYYQDLLD